MSDAAPKYQIGDEVAFANRSQPRFPPFVVTAVDTGTDNTLYQLGGAGPWWDETDLMPFSEWNQQFHADKSPNTF